jgi:hypothetical protein
MGPKCSLPCSLEPATGPYLIQMHPVHTFSPCFPKSHSNTINSLENILFFMEMKKLTKHFVSIELRELSIKKISNELYISNRGLLGCDAVKCCGRIPTFQRYMLPPSSGLWRCVVLWEDANVLEIHAASAFRVKWPEDGSSMDLRNVGSLPPTLHGVTTQETSTWNITGVKASKLAHKFLVFMCILFLTSYRKVALVTRWYEWKLRVFLRRLWKSTCLTLVGDSISENLNKTRHFWKCEQSRARAHTRTHKYF